MFKKTIIMKINVSFYNTKACNNKSFKTDEVYQHCKENMFQSFGISTHVYRHIYVEPKSLKM